MRRAVADDCAQSCVDTTLDAIVLAKPRTAIEGLTELLERRRTELNESIASVHTLAKRTAALHARIEASRPS